jgi:hypothetical protein
LSLSLHARIMSEAPRLEHVPVGEQIQHLHAFLSQGQETTTSRSIVAVLSPTKMIIASSLEIGSGAEYVAIASSSRVRTLHNEAIGEQIQSCVQDLSPRL